MRRQFIFLLALILLIPSFSESWTPKTYQLVVVKALRLMPLSFRNIMYRHKEEILSGSLQPDDTIEVDHRYEVRTRSGFLQDRILQLAEEIPRKINNHVHFREVAVDFGRLAHYISDLNDPLLLVDGDPREEQYQADFASYLEKSIDLFPWIFDGHEDALLKNNQLQNYIYNLATRSSRSYPLIGNSYFPNGILVSSDTFDPKSLPFGIASLSFSHSISDTVQIWFYAWKKAHGDTTFTPFYSKRTRRN